MLKDTIKQLKEKYGVTYKEIAERAGVKYGTFKTFMQIEDRRLRIESERRVREVVEEIEREITEAPQVEG